MGAPDRARCRWQPLPQQQPASTHDLHLHTVHAALQPAALPPLQPHARRLQLAPEPGDALGRCTVPRGAVDIGITQQRHELLLTVDAQRCSQRRWCSECSCSGCSSRCRGRWRRRGSLVRGSTHGRCRSGRGLTTVARCGWKSCIGSTSCDSHRLIHWPSQSIGDEQQGVVSTQPDCLVEAGVDALQHAVLEQEGSDGASVAFIDGAGAVAGVAVAGVFHSSNKRLLLHFGADRANYESGRGETRWHARSVVAPGGGARARRVTGANSAAAWFLQRDSWLSSFLRDPGPVRYRLTRPTQSTQLHFSATHVRCAHVTVRPPQTPIPSLTAQWVRNPRR